MSKPPSAFSVTVVIATVIVLGYGGWIWKQRNELVSCRKTLSSLGIGARIYANDHDDRFPPDLPSMASEIASTKALICPSDYIRQPAVNWISFSPTNSSYEVISTNLTVQDLDSIFVRCRIHGYSLRTDGAVLGGPSTQTNANNGQ